MKTMIRDFERHFQKYDILTMYCNEFYVLIKWDDHYRLYMDNRLYDKCDTLDEMISKDDTELFEFWHAYSFNNKYKGV